MIHHHFSLKKKCTLLWTENFKKNECQKVDMLLPSFVKLGAHQRNNRKGKHHFAKILQNKDISSLRRNSSLHSMSIYSCQIRATLSTINAQEKSKSIKAQIQDIGMLSEHQGMG